MAEVKVDPDIAYKKLVRFFLEREIANFYAYLDVLEKALRLSMEQVTEAINRAYSELAAFGNKDRQKAEELTTLLVEADKHKGFSNLMRQSFLTSLYSFMELWLVRDCHLDSKRRDGGKSYKSIKYRGILKAKNYFEKVIKSDYPFDTSQDWLWIINFKLLRECITHRQGSLSGFSDFEVNTTLINFVEKEKGLSLFGIDNKQVYIENEFCVKALKIVHQFMIEILSLEV